MTASSVTRALNARSILSVAAPGAPLPARVAIRGAAFTARSITRVVLPACLLILAACASSAPPAADNPGAITPSATAADFPTSPPELGDPAPLLMPPVVERRLPNGLRVLVVEHHELPLVTAMLAVRTGAEADPDGEAGLATMVADLLDEGTQSRNALQIAEQAALIGGSIFTSAGWDASTITLRGNTATLDSSLALMADVVLRPSFPAAELERLRADRLTGLVQLRDRGPAIADRVFNDVVFGAKHPYGRPTGGTEASTDAISRASVQRFYDTYYRPNNAVLVVVGDVSPDDLVSRVQALFGSWQRAQVPATEFDAPSAARAGRIYIVDKPGAPQSSVRIGTVGVERSSADYFPLVVMNTVLGGSFTSRLNQNLRETHGYTYGARSSFGMRREAGPFTASAEVTGTLTDSSLIEFFNELRAIGDTVPRAELEKTKRYLQLQLPGNFETTGGIAGELLTVALYDLPLDYFDSYTDRISAVTQADVQRVARKYVQPGAMQVVIVGDRESIEPAIRATGIADVTVRVFRE